MISIDKSIGKLWRTQRDNTWKPHGACNVTSYLMAADQAGIECPGDEDDFLAFMNRPHWFREIGKRFPWAYESGPSYSKYLYPPEQIHELLAEGFGQWTHGAGIAVFDFCRTRRELMIEILTGAGVVLSGKFPYRGGRSINHIVSLAGFETKQDDVAEISHGEIGPDRITNWIIDDPYGDYRTEYESHDGNGVKVSPEDFTRIFKGLGPGCRWAHILEVA